MNKIIWIGLFLIEVILLGGCTESPKKEISPEAKQKTENPNIKITYQQNSSTSLDWAGTYKGTLPCSDCDGIVTELTIQKDNTYIMRTIYMGKKERPSEQTGTFTWDAGGNSIRLSGMDDQPNQYLVGINTLLQLDKNGSKINTSDGHKYLLNKLPN